MKLPSSSLLNVHSQFVYSISMIRKGYRRKWAHFYLTYMVTSLHRLQPNGREINIFNGWSPVQYNKLHSFLCLIRESVVYFTVGKDWTIRPSEAK